jgi:Arc/MetJ family transcription regulator
MHVTSSSSIDKALLAKARELTGLRGQSAILNAGLKALIARESGRALIALGGSERHARVARRRREKHHRARG